jgi:hypothetical protein
MRQIAEPDLVVLLKVASDPSRNLRLSVKVVKCLHILTWWFAIRM